MVSCGTHPSASAIRPAGMLTTRPARWPSSMSFSRSDSSASLAVIASHRARWLAGAKRPAVTSKRAGTWWQWKSMTDEALALRIGGLQCRCRKPGLTEIGHSPTAPSPASGRRAVLGRYALDRTGRLRSSPARALYDRLRPERQCGRPADRFAETAGNDLPVDGVGLQRRSRQDRLQSASRRKVSLFERRVARELAAIEVRSAQELRDLRRRLGRNRAGLRQPRRQPLDHDRILERLMTGRPGS